MNHTALSAELPRVLLSSYFFLVRAQSGIQLGIVLHLNAKEKKV
jgi:hypothetical protein